MKYLMIIFASFTIVIGSPIVAKNKTATATATKITESPLTTSTPAISTLTSTSSPINQDDEIRKIILSSIKQSTVNNNRNDNRFESPYYHQPENNEDVKVIVYENPERNVGYYSNGYNSQVEPEIQIVSGSFDDIPDFSSLISNSNRNGFIPNYQNSGSSFNPANYNSYNLQSNNNYYRQNPNFEAIQNINPNIAKGVVDLIGKIIDEE